MGEKKKKTEKRAERTGNEQRAQGEKKTKRIRKEGEDEKLPHLDSCHVNSLHTNTHTLYL